MEARELSSGDSFSLGPLLTSVSPPRFSEPEREEFKPAGYRDSDSQNRRRKENAGNAAQEAEGPGREGDSSFPGSTLLVQVSIRVKESARITVTAPNRQGRQHWEKEQE